MLVQEYNKPIKPGVDIALGYAVFHDPTHPLASNTGRVYLHRHMASIKLGRWLEPGECVHHINGNKHDNSPENLLVMSSSQHTSLHRRMQTTPPPDRECQRCGKISKNRKYCSYDCARLKSRKVAWPTPEQLAKDISELSWLAIGRKYGVSDNAARKWARKYGLIPPVA